MRKLLVVLAAVGLGVGLAGCSWLFHPQPPQEGVVRIIITRAQPLSVSPEYIPPQAQYVRVRVWQRTTGVNVVRTAAIPPSGSASIELRIPAHNNYTIDAVSYVVQGSPAYGFLLTGDRVTGVDVVAGATTSVNLVLSQWSVTFSGDTEVTSGETYTVTARISHRDQLFTDFFRSGAAYLLASLDSYQTSSSTLPPPVATGTISNGRISLSATAPDVEEQSTFYCSILAHLNRQWYDPEYPNVAVVLEIPNRQLGEPLHQIIVNPPEGGIIIGISKGGERDVSRAR